MRPLLIACAAMLLAAAACGAETIERVVVFRDGTVLRLPLPGKTFTIQQFAGGRIAEYPLGWGMVRALTFAPKPDLSAFVRAKTLAEELGHEDYAIRERAHQELAKLAAGLRDELLALHKEAADPEVRMRLGQVLAASAGEAQLERFALADKLELDGGTALRADLSGLELSAEIGGQKIALGRENVARILAPDLWKEEAPGALAVGAATGGGAVFERIADDADNAFPADATRIDFEKAPDGAALTAGMDIGRTFVAKGFSIATSIEGAIVSVNNYNVNAKSQGNSCATHQPLWNGQLTIRFCAPGRPEIPAAVTRAGLYIAAVSRDSTALEAYDARGQRIAEIKTVKGHTDFLGLKSRVPIAFIKVVPNLGVDPDYTIDDLVFDTPRPLGAWGDAKRHAVRLRGGERVLCDEVSVAGGQLTLRGLSIGVPEWTRPLAEAERIVRPWETWQAAAPVEGVWCRLRDGSLLRAGDENGLFFPLIPATKVSAEVLREIWSDHATRFDLDAMTPPRREGVHLLAEKTCTTFARHEFTATGIRLELEDNDQSRSFAYDKLPHLVFAWPEANAPASVPALSLTTGESLALRAEASPDSFYLKEWNAKEIVVARGKEEVRLPAGQVQAVTLPEAK